MPISETTVDITKGVFIILCLVVSIVAGILPMKLQGCKSNPKVVGLLNSFSGGVFLAIALMHIIPETVSTYYEYRLHDTLAAYETQETITVAQLEYVLDRYESFFPVPFIVVVFGYSLILLVDKVVIDANVDNIGLDNE